MPRRHLHKRQRLPPTEGGCEHELSGGRPPPRPMLMEIENYSSSHKDWSCWAGLHPPSKADAVCAIPSRAPRLCVHQTGSRGGAEARRARAGLARSVRRGCTRRWKRALHVPPRGGTVGGTACRAPHIRRWKWAPRATRQTRTRVNVFENCYKFSISISPTANAV